MANVRQGRAGDLSKSDSHAGMAAEKILHASSIVAVLAKHLHNREDGEFAVEAYSLEGVEEMLQQAHSHLTDPALRAR